MTKNKPGYDAEYQRKRRAAEPPEQTKARKAANAERDRLRRAKQKTGRVGAPRMVEDDPTSPRTVTLQESHWEIVAEVGKGIEGAKGFYSAGLRHIIEDWKRRQSRKRAK